MCVHCFGILLCGLFSRAVKVSVSAVLGGGHVRKIVVLHCIKSYYCCRIPSVNTPPPVQVQLDCVGREENNQTRNQTKLNIQGGFRYVSISRTYPGAYKTTISAMIHT